MNPSKRLHRLLFATLAGLGLLLILFNSLLPVRADLQDDFTLIGIEPTNTTSLAWGDWDGDGDLDLAVGNQKDPNNPAAGYLQIFKNDGGILKLDPIHGLGWQSAEKMDTTSVAWGDWDGDGDLDLAVGRYSEPSRVYVNVAGKLIFDLANGLGWEDDQAWHTTSVAWGDWDGDGDLDLAIGNYGAPTRVYENQSGTLLFDPLNNLGWEAPSYTYTQALAWGDWDGDGDLDLAAANNNGPNLVYENEAGTLENNPAMGKGWQSPLVVGGLSLAWGDWDGDGDLDLAIGSYSWFIQVFENNAGTLSLDPANGLGWSSPSVRRASSVTWGDWDGDGDLDLAAGNTLAPVEIWENDGQTLRLDMPNGFGWQAKDSRSTASVAWGDVDNDGDLDLAVGNLYKNGYNQLYTNNGGALSLDTAKGLGWEASSNKNTYSVAWGDWDNDGDLDLAIGNEGSLQVYENEAGALQLNPPAGLGWEVSVSASSLAWGDWDGDGDLDLATDSRVYENDAGTLKFDPLTGFGWQAPDLTLTATSVAWGDWDGDGDLDLARGIRYKLNCGPGWCNIVAAPNQVWENDGGILKLDPANGLGWESPNQLNTQSVAWGDWDNDGDLDLAVGKTEYASEIWENEAGVLKLDPDHGFGWQATHARSTTSVDWGDWDDDGDLDLAVGNDYQLNEVYENTGGDLSLAWISPDSRRTYSVAWGDWDGDGDLDLAEGNISFSNGDPIQIWENDGGALSLGWQAPVARMTSSVAWGDWDQDGDLDLAAGNYSELSQVYENQQQGAKTLQDNLPTIRLEPPDPGRYANFYASPEFLSDPVIPITYTLSDPQNHRVGKVLGYYSFNGGGDWLPAIAASGTITTHLSASPTGTQYIFRWDTFASGFFGQSDNVIFRLEAYPQAPASVAPGAYQYANSVAGPFQRTYHATATFPLRVRGTQVRVVDASGPVQDALVYLLPKGQSACAQPMPSAAAPYTTDLNGYLQGHGVIHPGDTLYALAPISTTERYTLYATNGQPNPTGLGGHLVTQPGVQQITVTADQPLLLFNADLSLEWDPRNDGNFLGDLEQAIQQASAVLYDTSDGQIALGEVRVHLDREGWQAADVVMYAQSGIRPRASMGGVVDDLTDDVVSATQTITNAYGPGQVRMGPNWDPFGSNLAELTVDWQRALAHELSHYLLFLPDNYLGVENGQPISTDCKGSFMTNTYDDTYSEYLIRPVWEADPECLKTIAQHTTGRVDWETVRHFYPMLQDPVGLNPGPAVLPLDVTRFTLTNPGSTASTLAPRIFDVRREGTLFAVPRGQAFLFQDQGTVNLSDDQVIALGSTVGGGDRVKVRGAVAGDRLCLLGPPDADTGESYAGCVESLEALDASIPVKKLTDWQPNIIVHEVTSVTLQVTVTLPVSISALNVQFFPAYSDPLLPSISPTATMTALDALNPVTYTQALSLSSPAFEGWVRVWAPGENPPHEAMSQVFLNPPWGPNSEGFHGGGNARAWGANFRQLGAPVASGDGQITIFNLEDIFADTGTVSLQAINNLPGLPAWLAQVGQGYRFVADEQFPRVIAFDYLQREAPPGYEYTLTVYYSPDEGANWQRLPTRLNMDRNQATARMPDNAQNSQGLYALAATIEMPALDQGWNLFAYAVPQARPVGQALASIEGKYTSVYSNLGGQWKLYDATVIRDHPQFNALVNDLAGLDFGRAYWLYATEVVTPYLGVPGETSPRLVNLGQPPATYYGWVEPWLYFTPKAGDAVKAWIDGNLCGTGVVVDSVEPVRLAYKVQVAADANGNGCGTPNRKVVFQVGEYILPMYSVWWEDSQAICHPFGPPPVVLFYPIIFR